MSYKSHSITEYSIGATLDDGQRTEFKAIQSGENEYYPVHEVDQRCNLGKLFQELAKICKSSKDIAILGELLQETNVINELVIDNISEYAQYFNVSRKKLTLLLAEADKSNLLYKINTGRYFVNPYILISPQININNYEAQELVQVRWKELTGLFTELEIEQIKEFSSFLGLDQGLRATEFNLSVAKYYAKNHTITDKQRKAYIKIGVIDE